MPVHLGSHEREHQDRDRAQPGDAARATCTCSTTPTTAARTCPTSRWSRRCTCEAGDASAVVLRRLPRPPCRHRRHHAGLDAAVQHDASTRKACCSTTSCSCATARCARRSCCALLRQRPPGRRATREQTIADLRAQIAANEKGVQELRAMVAQFGRDTVAAYMRHVQDNAEESVRRVITALKDGEFTLPLDNGAQIQVQGHGGRRRSARPRSTSPAPARSCRTTSTRPRR